MTTLQDIRRSLAELKYDIESITAEFKSPKFMLALKAGFNPDEPRDEQGRWAQDTMSLSESSGADNRLAAKGNEAECEAQHKLDSAICRIVQTSLCWRQAITRRAACVSGYPLPPLNF